MSSKTFWKLKCVIVYLQISPRKKALLSRSLREQKSHTRTFAEKIREISRKLAQTIFSPRDFAEKLRENSPRNSANFRADTPQKLGVISKKFLSFFYFIFVVVVVLFDLWF